MKKPGEVVLKETRYIAASVFILSIILQIVFVVIKKWDYTVLLGNLLSGTSVVLNFLAMGMTIEKAVTQEEKSARATAKTSQTLRQLALFVIVAIGVLLPFFNTWTVIIPLIFPRISISLRPLFGKNR